ncbi:MAG: hypothetical protein P8I61_02530 [Opitutae bacterium]|jgi:hypothetical protein|nr:hypothetical protein [Opitutae bacterium]
MAKIDIEKLKHILHRNENDVQKINDILNDIATELQIEQAEKEARPPVVKKQFITLIADNEGVLVDQDFASWVVQIPEDTNPQAVIDKIHQSAYTYNATPKGSRFPVKSVGETLESVSAKTFKENDVWVKTKIPVLAVSCKNQLPQV